MKIIQLSIISLGLLSACTTLENKVDQNQIQLTRVSSYATGLYDQSSAEIISYDSATKLAFVTNAGANAVDVISLADINQPSKQLSIDISPYGSPNSVAVYDGLVAVAVEAKNKQDLGSVVLFDTTGQFLNQLTVGALPDMVRFSPDGKTILVANEGEPNAQYTVDPEGSIAVIKVSLPAQDMTQADVKIADFKAFNKTNIDPKIRIFGPNATVAQDLEPEYITVSDDSRTAWISLQENNAIAVLDIAQTKVTKLLALGTKSFNTPQTAIDASDKDGKINIQPWPVVGLYQPDTIASYQVQGETYLVTANEGDARDYDGFSEETRVKKLKLDESLLKQYPNLQDKDQLGRLKTTTVDGDLNNDGKVEQITAYGARSFSIWTADGQQVFDSGNDIARLTSVDPALFNGNDKRSDDKGAEPEALTVGKVGNQTYAFIGLERTSGILVYNISKPQSPKFVQYINTNQSNGDLAPEGMQFVSKGNSPNGQPLLLVANEVSGTTSIYQITQK